MEGNNAPFAIGQKVVALRTSRNIVKDRSYTIHGVNRFCCIWVVDVGIKVPWDTEICCVHCRSQFPVSFGSIWWLSHKLFAPIEPRHVEIAEEILNSIKTTEEVPDIIKVPETVNN